MNGICQCGCGQPTARAKRSYLDKGIQKGDYARFIRGHSSRKSQEGYVEEDRGHSTACWIWTGAVGSRGYGVARVDGKPFPAHRVIFEREKGLIPEGLCLDHLCRVRSCVNPVHLDPVTIRENNLRGLSTKLSDEQVSEIRDTYTGVRGQQTALAKEYGVRPATINAIVRNKRRVDKNRRT